MTSTLLVSQGQLLSRKKQIHPLHHWKTWVVPACLLRDFILDHKHIWQLRYSPPHIDSALYGTVVPNEKFGWRAHLALEVSMFTGQSLDAVHRHIYRVMAVEGRVSTIEFAEAVVLSLGLFIDQDTNIPVLPGNLRNAQELLEVRDPKFWERPEKERLHFQREVMELCGEIIRHPERLKELQDAAPFDCLRPPR